MKILFLIPYAPSLIRVRSFNLIREIASRGHKVTLATLWTDESELGGMDTLRAEGVRIVAQRLPRWRSFVNCLLALPTGAPLQSVYSWHSDLAQRVTQLLLDPSEAPYDIVHVEHLRGARYGQNIRDRMRAAGRSIPIVWDSVDCISYLFQRTTEKGSVRASRWIAALERPRTERLEGLLPRQFDMTLVTSETDRAELMSLPSANGTSRNTVSVIPNGVDLEYFRPARGDQPEPATVVLSGKMSYHANVAMVDYFMDRIFPPLKQRRPEIKVWIVGKDPPRRIEDLGVDPDVTVTGTVPDMRPFLQKATVAAVPLTYGAGIQNKVLEAMACGTPVVASSIAARSLQAEVARELLVAETPAEYVRAISGVIDNPDRRDELSRAGRRYVEEHHDWSAIAADLEEIYLGINGH